MIILWRNTYMVKDETCEIKLPMIQGSATHLCKHAKVYFFISMEAEIWLFWWLVVILLLVSANEGNEEDVDIGGDEIHISSFPPVEIERHNCEEQQKQTMQTTIGAFGGEGQTLIGILPYAGLKFYIYEKLKRHVFEEHQRSIMMRLCCGALAGLFGQTFTYPLDVVRRQMQVENMQTFGGGSGARHKGITTIVSEQGWRQLFAGLSINYIKIVPLVSIGFTTFDMMKSLLRIPPRQKKRNRSLLHKFTNTFYAKWQLLKGKN
uniref:Uncharacterized protein n=1 Tax=Lactuca sativa TaxID=4236 RepID=A0A9R1VUZ0_LACSA|nr:hypothetical protein LSAT_V11C400170480 [Lactuca sativa]